MTEKQKKEILELGLKETNILFNENMAKHTTFKVGGEAECFIKIDNMKDLRTVLVYARNNNIKITVIGNGSNVLVLDKGIKGIVLNIRINKIETVNYDGRIFAKIGAGVKISMLGHLFLKNGITGFEELSGIPGTIGGAIRMNAGAHGKEFKDIVNNVTCMDYDGNIVKLENKDMQFEYRKSILKDKKYIVIEVEMMFQNGNEEEIKEKMTQYAKYRKEKQPIEYPSAGSTFKRGNDFITAKLIDEAGLKGYNIGGAEVSEKHAGFVINKGNATAKDILELIKYIQDKIYKEFEKKIELEIEIIGDE
ncbi:MAG: UDP-N-acetylmuramate dehydrogenase [Clostridia bacterium]